MAVQTYIYDLASAPASFDFVTWLSVCATDAQAPFNVAIIPGPNHGFRHDDLAPRDVIVREQFLHNVMIPATRLFPVRSLAVFPEQEPEGKRLPYSARALLTGKPVVGLNVPAWAMREVERRHPSNNLVTITLRETPHHPQRNSNTAEWIDVASRLTDEGWDVLFVRDAFTAGEKMAGWDTFASPDNLFLRAAIYQHAAMNLCTNAGTSTLCYFNPRANYLMAKMVATDTASTEEYLARLGWLRGYDCPWALPGQKFLWADDTADAILAQFQATPKERRPDAVFNAAMTNPIMVGIANTSDEVMLGQIRRTLRDKEVRWWTPDMQITKPVVVVGGGPSLSGSLSAIRKRYRAGAEIWALNGTHDWLIERSIIPTRHFLIDARPGNIEFVRKPHAHVQYWVAAQCHESVWGALAGYDTVAWLAYTEGIEQMLTSEGADRAFMVVMGGGTVLLKTMFIASISKAKTLHLYGVDSCLSKGGDHHAYSQPLNDGMPTMEFEVEIDGEVHVFTCQYWMVRQAKDFDEQLTTLHNAGVKVFARGDGLLPFVARAWKRRNTEKIAA
jgi:hypothetical protein